PSTRQAPSASSAAATAVSPGNLSAPAWRDEPPSISFSIQERLISSPAPTGCFNCVFTHSAGDRSILQERVVRIAVQPALPGLRRADDGMPGRVRMMARVAVRRAVAAEGGAALLAGTQVDPAGADFHALLAHPKLRVFDGFDRGEMRTVGHDFSP